MEETHNTLKFGFRAKNVKVKSFVNEVLDEKALLKQYRLEILQLKRRMCAITPLGGSIASEEEIIQVIEQKKIMEEKLKEHEQTKQALEERIKKLTQLILVSSNPFPGEMDSLPHESYTKKDTDVVAAQPDFILHNQTGNVSVHGAQSPQINSSPPPHFDDSCVSDLQRQVLEQESTITSLLEEVEHKGAHIRDLNSAIASLQNKLRINEHLQQQVSNLRDEIQQRDDRIQELMDAFSLQSLQNKPSDQVRPEAYQDPNITELKMKLNIQSSENQKLTSELHAKDTELTRWMRQYNTLERRLQTLEEENRALRSRNRPSTSALPLSHQASYTSTSTSTPTSTQHHRLGRTLSSNPS